MRVNMRTEVKCLVELTPLARHVLLSVWLIYSVNPYCLLPPHFRYLLMSLLGLVSMGLFLLFTTNGCILHAWMNFNAEITRFADRHFYEVGSRGIP